MSDLHLLPYLRRGLARHVAQPDPNTGSIGPGEIPMALKVAGQDVSQTVQLLAPHHVASIQPSEITRRYPVPNAVDVETNFFPLVEFAAPDLPWRYTPAAPASKGRLRPWIALVVVEASATGIEYTETSDAMGRLTVDPTALDQLPPVDELWAWAHVQSSHPTDQVASAAVEAPETLLSRVLCPRRLEPDTTYRAALVNAFSAGVDERSQPAWSSSATESIQLTVFDTWTFTTAQQAGDFESLCELLEPATEAGELGIRPVDVTEPGIDVNWFRPPVVIDFIGALADVGVDTNSTPRGNAAFATTVEPVLNEVLSRAGDEATPPDYDPLRDDPVVGMPFYGSWAADVDSVPASGWARGLNVRTDRRIAAGLGARTIRKNQEALMAAAWDQLGSIREAADELNRGRLSAEVGRAWQSRLATVDDGDRVGLAAPLLTYLRVDGEPARKVAAESVAPNSIADRAWLRRTPRARAASASSAYLRAASDSASEEQLLAVGYRSITYPEGIRGREIELESNATADTLFDSVVIDHVSAGGIATQVGGQQLNDFVMNRSTTNPTTPTVRQPRRVATTIPVVAGAPAAGIATAVANINPLTSVRASLNARIPAFTELLPAGELPAEFGLVPQFLDALFWDLAKIDQDVLVPGLGEFPENRVRLLAVNGGFIGAYLAAANYEMAREFLWREYPADLGGTFFQRFFDYANADTVDIEPVADWDIDSTLSDNVPNAAATTVVLIRADLVRRYPEVNIFLAPQDAQGEPNYRESVQPSFEGRLAGDVLVVGFPLAPEIVLGQKAEPEHFLVFEERMTAPRFGLDVSRKGRLTTWDEIAWTDFESAGTHIGPGPIDSLGTPTFDGVEWGRNAAHQAAAVHQRPFRRLYPATHLVNL